MSNMRAHRRRADRNRARTIVQDDSLAMMELMTRAQYPESWCETVHERHNEALCGLFFTTAMLRAWSRIMEPMLACEDHGYSDPIPDFLVSVELTSETDSDEPELGVIEIGWKIGVKLACGCPRTVEMYASPDWADGMVQEAWDKAKTAGF